jgi:pimeloyl-ACP methyl ester carboxylesterase
MQVSVLETSTSYQFFKKAHAPTLVLVHGWLQDWQTWSPVLQELSKNYQVVIPDLPAFGSSSIPAAWTPEKYAEWLATFISLLNLDKKQPLYICGHSFGGKITAITAAIHGSLFQPVLRGIILVSSSGLPDPLSTGAQFKQSLISAVPEPLKSLLPKKLKEKVLTKIGVATDNLQSNKVQKEILKKTVQHSIQEYLPKIAVPTLLIWGVDDQTTPVHQGKAMHICLAQSELVLFQASGHFPYIDEPKKFVQTIDMFVQNTSKK